MPGHHQGPLPDEEQTKPGNTPTQNTDTVAWQQDRQDVLITPTHGYSMVSIDSRDIQPCHQKDSAKQENQLHSTEQPHHHHHRQRQRPPTTRIPEESTDWSALHTAIHAAASDAFGLSRKLPWDTKMESTLTEANSISDGSRPTQRQRPAKPVSSKTQNAALSWHVAQSPCSMP